MKKKEAIYVAASFTSGFVGLTWVQLAYNDPSILLNKTWKEIAVLILISLAVVLANTLITWLAYLSDPNAKPGAGLPKLPTSPTVTP